MPVTSSTHQRLIWHILTEAPIGQLSRNNGRQIASTDQGSSAQRLADCRQKQVDVKASSRKKKAALSLRTWLWAVLPQEDVAGDDLREGWGVQAAHSMYASERKEVGTSYSPPAVAQQLLFWWGGGVGQEEGTEVEEGLSIAIHQDAALDQVQETKSANNAVEKKLAENSRLNERGAFSKGSSISARWMWFPPKAQSYHALLWLLLLPVPPFV